MKSDGRNILFVQLFSNGDCLYATAVARQIKTDFPGCRLTWAIAPFCKGIIENNPFVDEILVTDAVPKNDVAAFRRYKRKLAAEKAKGKWDEVFVTMNMDTNLALYDGTIRGMILRAYGRPMTVPLQPVLRLKAAELSNVENFAARYRLASFKHVILWEYAPQSGQSKLSKDLVWSVAEKITELPDVCVVLSSANSFESSDRIIDASVLTVRENAALTHHCSLLVGCSSGITWLNTSDAAAFLPMLQLLNPQAEFMNAPSVDFARYNIAHNGLIEMLSFNPQKITDCLTTILTEGFTAAQSFNEKLPGQFSSTKKIVYNLLVYREFSAIRKHIAIMIALYGRDRKLMAAVRTGLAGAPVKLLTNIFRKNFLQKS